MIDKLPLDYSFLDSYQFFDWYLFIGITLLPNLIILFVAILMWFNPYSFLHHISDEESIPVKDIDINHFSAILIAILGLYILTFSVSDIIYNITTIKITKSITGIDYHLQPRQIGEIVSACVKFLLGIFLIYGRNIVMVLIQQFKREFQKPYNTSNAADAKSNADD